MNIEVILEEIKNRIEMAKKYNNDEAHLILMDLHKWISQKSKEKKVYAISHIHDYSEPEMD